MEYPGDFPNLKILVEEEAQKDAAQSRIDEVSATLGYGMTDTAGSSYLSILQGRRNKSAAPKTKTDYLR